MNPHDALRHLLHCRSKGECCVRAYITVRLAMADLVESLDGMVNLVDRLASAADNVLPPIAKQRDEEID